MISAVAAMMIMPDRSFELAIRWLATGAVAALTVRKVNNYRAFFVRSFIFTFVLVLSLAIVFATLHRELAPDREHFALLLGIALGNAFVVSVLALVIVFAFELIFNIDTNMALMVLSDYNHPLLERLKREAPGTMFHSMSVATLAEDAAREIGANVLRAKVGALFHDIGKLSKPHYFVEDNRDSSNEHFKLNPQLSSSIIREHVKEGLALARQYRLFRWVHRAIISHHGDDLVYFFYQMAKKQQELSSDAPPVLESQFRYTGTPPREKELVIISLADACEAACRSLERPSPAKIEQLVDDIFLKRYQGGQLRNGELTLAELDRVKKSFVKSLLSIYHGRIAYSPENINEQTVLQVEKSGTSQTGKK
jgi:putative nucleotidyltransferase with HDIG domain